MSLLVMVLCLLSERYLVNKTAHDRFHWFRLYSNAILPVFSKLPPNILLAMIVLPPVVVVGVVLQAMSHVFFDVMGLFMSLVIFYYCIGPINPFYPAHAKVPHEVVDQDVGSYLVRANDELFAVLFWYVVLGPLGILAYRLVSLSQGLTAIDHPAKYVLERLDWFPARMTALLYLLVGHFQAGYSGYKKLFLSNPSQNNTLLSTCGLAALQSNEPQTMLHAEHLVEHATILFLVLLAFCTIVAWV